MPFSDLMDEIIPVEVKYLLSEYTQLVGQKYKEISNQLEDEIDNLMQNKKLLNLPDRINSIEGMTKSETIPENLSSKLSDAKSKGGVRNLKNSVDQAKN